VTTFQRQLLKELGAGADGEPISKSKLVYLQERLRGRFFDFLLSKFEEARENGLSQAKLARRIRKSPEVINRWLSAPANLTLESISDLFAGIAAEEPQFSSSSLLGRPKVNRFHLDDTPIDDDSTEQKGLENSALDQKGLDQKGARQGGLPSIEEAAP
jgi:transcriptional regulator with XRE-family HTH domain